MTLISSITSISNVKSKSNKSLVSQNNILNNKNNEIQFSNNQNEALISGIIYSLATMLEKVVLFISTIILETNGEKQFTDEYYQAEFIKWMNNRNVHYDNQEFLYRFKIFSDNVDKVENWNKKGSETVLGLNKFADLTNEEFKSIYVSKSGGIKLSSKQQEQQKDQHQNQQDDEDQEHQKLQHQNLDLI